MSFSFKKTLKNLRRQVDMSLYSYSPLITINLSKSALLHNLNEFKKLAPQGQVAPVLKSNAYGHGLVLIAEVLDKEKCPFLVVDSFYEAHLLKKRKIRTGILVLGYTPTTTILNNRFRNISFTITSLEALKELDEVSTKEKSDTRIHLKIDTGMHRQGILVEEVDTAFEILEKNPHIILEGMCSHFSDSDGENDVFTQKQIGVWNEIVKKARSKFSSLTYFHISNTSGHLFSKDIDANVSRLGLGLYGLAKIPNHTFKPVLEMKTILTSVKKIPAGETVGYNNTFTASKDMTIATLPVGYYEGLDRKLSNKGFVKVKGVYCPIVGRVSMNISTIDVTEVPNPKIGDEVQIISPNSQDKNSILGISSIAETIPYEEVVKIPEKLRRVWVE